MVRDLLTRWYVLLADVAREAERRLGRSALHPRGDRHPGRQRLHRLEALLLLGFERPVMPIRSSLRRIGVLIREHEEAAKADQSGGAKRPDPIGAAGGPVVAG